MVRLRIHDVTGRLRRLRQERGQVLAEYALIITLLAITTVAATVIAFRGTVLAAFNAVSGCFTDMPCS